MTGPDQDRLNTLAGLRAPDPDPAARRAAVSAAMAAFAAAQESESAGQGSSFVDRLRSALLATGNRIMEKRLPLAGAALALIALPLAYQLHSTTGGGARVEVAADVEAPAPVPQPLAPPSQPAAKPAQLAVRKELAARAAPPAPAPAPPVAAVAAMEPAADLYAAQEAAPPPAGAVMAPSKVAGLTAEPSGDRFKSFDESPLKSVASDPVSTFSIDVDTASYSYVRASLSNGILPPPDAVRIEEMLNYFPYDYPAPTKADVPFSVSLAAFPTPWNAKTELLRIGVKGYAPPPAARKAEHLVFLIDTSGSMDEPDKLPLLKRSFALLAEKLGAEDTVAIVAYAGSAGVVLEPTKASDKAKILSALDSLDAGGATAGAEGIELAYRLAEQSKQAGTVNRVILATDGDFNVGIADPDALKDFIRRKRDDGITLSVLGFGRGNLDDALMQALAQNGNGNASYIDSYAEARKVLVEEAGGTLDMIAKDVKIQLEFNPALVSEYRLIGYETRSLAREDFNNDKVDAGDIGAGHMVTALYEITPAGKGAEAMDALRYPAAKPAPEVDGDRVGELGFLKIRYKLPDSDTSRLIETPIPQALVVSDIGATDADARFAAAVAAFGQKLKGSNYAGTMSWDAIRSLAAGAVGSDKGGYRAEFLRLLPIAEQLSDAH